MTSGVHPTGKSLGTNANSNPASVASTCLRIPKDLRQPLYPIQVRQRFVYNTMEKKWTSISRSQRAGGNNNRIHTLNLLKTCKRMQML